MAEKPLKDCYSNPRRNDEAVSQNGGSGEVREEGLGRHKEAESLDLATWSREDGTRHHSQRSDLAYVKDQDVTH